MFAQRRNVAKFESARVLFSVLRKILCDLVEFFLCCADYIES